MGLLDGRRALIFGFPSQIASLGPVAERFLNEIFKPSRLEARFLDHARAQAIVNAGRYDDAFLQQGAHSGGFRLHVFEALS